MNLSGKAVKYWMDKEKIAMENILVIVDEVALPLSKLRLSQAVVMAGHNGLKSIQESLGTTEYPSYVLVSGMIIRKECNQILFWVNGERKKNLL